MDPDLKMYENCLEKHKESILEDIENGLLRPENIDALQQFINSFEVY